MEKVLNDMNELLVCSDASDSHAFIFEMKKFENLQEKKFDLVQEFEFSDYEKTLSSGFRELLSVIKFTENYIPVQNSENSIIFWLTDSKNLFSFLKKGSRKKYIQSEI